MLDTQGQKYSRSNVHVVLAGQPNGGERGELQRSFLSLKKVAHRKAVHPKIIFGECISYFLTPPCALYKN